MPIPFVGRGPFCGRGPFVGSAPFRGAGTPFSRFGGFSPASLFARGEQGAWYDPSDLTTLFQNSSGTTPVTAVEQPVGLMRDRSGRGNHASQSTDAARPTLRARYNLLTYSERFDNAAWSKTNVTATSDTDTAPDGSGTTADTLAATATNGTALQSFTAVAASYTFSVWLRRKTGTGNVDIAADSGTYTTQSITTSWARYSVTQTLTAGAKSAGIRLATSGDEVYAWGAQLIVANDLASNAYQRIAAENDYDADPAKFRPYLAFDGTDDAMYLADDSLDALGGENQPFAMWAGVRRESTATQAIFMLSDNTNAVGSDNDQLNFGLSSSGGQFRGLVRNFTAPSTYDDKFVDAGAFSSPATFVCAWARSSSTGQARVNGSAGTAADQTQAAINLKWYTVGAARRGSTPTIISYLQGRLYSLIVLGRAASATEIAATEKYVAAKTGVTL